MLKPQLAPNPSAGKEHRFTAYRMKGMGSGMISLKSATQVIEAMALGDEE